MARLRETAFLECIDLWFRFRMFDVMLTVRYEEGWKACFLLRWSQRCHRVGRWNSSRNVENFVMTRYGPDLLRNIFVQFFIFLGIFQNFYHLRRLFSILSFVKTCRLQTPLPRCSAHGRRRPKCQWKYVSFLHHRWKACGQSYQSPNTWTDSSSTGCVRWKFLRASLTKCLRKICLACGQEVSAEPVSFIDFATGDERGHEFVCWVVVGI